MTTRGTEAVWPLALSALVTLAWSSDLFVLARAALEGAVRNADDLISLAAPANSRSIVIPGFANADIFAGIAAAMSGSPRQADIMSAAGYVRKVRQEQTFTGGTASTLLGFVAPLSRC
jgi:hypothetical protein